MSLITSTPGWDNVTLLDPGTPATGGIAGTMNAQAQALVNRLGYLKRSLTVLTKADLRNVNKTKFDVVRVMFNEIPFDFGGGDYYLDAADTSSTDNNGTVVVGTDGGRWKLAKFDVLYPLNFGAVPVSTADSLTALNNCLTEAAAIAAANGSKVIVDLQGQPFYVSAANVLSIAQNVEVRNGMIGTIGTSFTATDPLIKMVSNDYTNLVNMIIDTNWKCAGLLRSNSQHGVVDSCTIRRFQSFGVKDTNKNTESLLTRTKVNQYEWGDTGYDLSTNRTAYGIWSDSADCLYSQVVSNYAKYPLYVTGTLNQFNNFHVYNGAYSDSTPGVNIRFESPAKDNVFTNGYYDNGCIQMADSFVQVFSGGVFQLNSNGTNTTCFELYSSTANADAAGLIVGNMAFNGNYVGSNIQFFTTGSGSWAADKKISWTGNSRSDGGTSYSIAQWLDKGVVSAAGNLVMGSTSERSVLGAFGRIQVAASAAGYAGATFLKYGADINPSTLYLGKTRSATLGAFSPLQSGDVIGRIAAGGDAGADYDQLGATIDFRAPSVWSATSTPIEIRFSTVANGATTRLVRWVLNEAALSPFTNNSYDLGTTSTRVKTVYSLNLDVSTAATFSGTASFAGTTTFPGPFADDASAATGGVAVGGAYRGTDGFVHCRLA